MFWLMCHITDAPAKAQPKIQCAAVKHCSRHIFNKCNLFFFICFCFLFFLTEHCLRTRLCDVPFTTGQKRPCSSNNLPCKSQADWWLLSHSANSCVFSALSPQFTSHNFFSLNRKSQNSGSSGWRTSLLHPALACSLAASFSTETMQQSPVLHSRVKLKFSDYPVVNISWFSALLAQKRNNLHLV